MIKHELKLFPTLVTRVDGFLNEQQVSDVFNFCMTQKVHPHDAYLGDALSNHVTDKSFDFFNLIQSNVPSCRDIKSRLYDLIDDYRLKYGLAKLTYANSWFNIQNEGSSMLDHVHSGSIVSGALYINVDHDSSKIYFHNPNNIVGYYKTSENLTEYNFDFYYFYPAKGSLFLFPSWLKHGSFTDKNETKNRLAISFNTTYLP